MFVIEFLKPWELEGAAAWFFAALCSVGVMVLFMFMFAACEIIADKTAVWLHNIRVAIARRCRRSARFMAWLDMEQAETENSRKTAGRA